MLATGRPPADPRAGYTVTCAYREENGAVTLHVRDRFTPDSMGVPYLVGPGSCEWGRYD
ncbi:hypothetical protein Acsp03_67060 [Actinomadura sp. NBRC 104412]|nr:hypothetical protein Acsp03_67060 [Actinomadura sp. NBRC 104412]